MTPKASISPAEQADMMNRRKDAEAHELAERRKLAISMENILGKEAGRTTDQKRVWDFLTREVWCVSRGMDSNALLIFEGARRKAVEISVLVEEASQPVSL